MGLNWGGVTMQGGEMPAERREPVRRVIDQFADELRAQLIAAGLSPVASPALMPVNVYVLEDAIAVHLVLTKLIGGMQSQVWNLHIDQHYSESALAEAVRRDTAQEVVLSLQLPKPEEDEVTRSAHLRHAATREVLRVLETRKFSSLGDLTGREHLKPALEEFLRDHPDPDRNVFIMMRFLETDRHNAIRDVLRTSFGAHGFHAVRADDKEYSDGLWSNIEVYLTGCRFGVAVYEEIDDRRANPNVSLELGYMYAMRRRCLILKEQRMETLPADVNHRLYRPFDMFDIEGSIPTQVERWIRDLPSAR